MRREPHEILHPHKHPVWHPQPLWLWEAPRGLRQGRLRPTKSMHYIHETRLGPCQLCMDSLSALHIQSLLRARRQVPQNTAGFGKLGMP